MKNNKIGSIIGVGDSYVGAIQMLRGIGEYGQPYYNFCDWIILLTPSKPYTYAVGPQDCKILEKFK